MSTYRSNATGRHVPRRISRDQHLRGIFAGSDLDYGSIVESGRGHLVGAGGDPRAAADDARKAERENAPDPDVTARPTGPGARRVILDLSRLEVQTIAEALDFLAGIDEGENTDYHELSRLARELEERLESHAR